MMNGQKPYPTGRLNKNQLVAWEILFSDSLMDCECDCHETETIACQYCYVFHDDYRWYQ